MLTFADFLPSDFMIVPIFKKPYVSNWFSFAAQEFARQRALARKRRKRKQNRRAGKAVGRAGKRRQGQGSGRKARRA